jgi:PAS domain-containing protein
LREYVIHCRRSIDGRATVSPRLPAFADRLSVALLLYDPGIDAIVDANDAAGSLYGYPVADLRELAVSELSAESPRFSDEKAERWIRAAAEGTERAFEWQIIRHNLRNDTNVVMGHAESLRRALAGGDHERQAAIVREVAADVGGTTEAVARIEGIATNDATDFVPTDVVAAL